MSACRQILLRKEDFLAAETSRLSGAEVRGVGQVSRPNLDHRLILAILERMTPQEIAPVLELGRLREYPLGAFFFTPEEPTEHLFALEVGRVDVYRITLSGKRLLLRHLFPQTVFGVLGQSLQGCFAQAAERCVVRIVTRERLLELFSERPDIAIRILELVSYRLRQTEQLLEQAFFSGVKARLAGFLLANMDPSTGIVAGFTHEEIGESIVALRQTVTEMLQFMYIQGVLEVQRRQIRVIKRDKLNEIARDGD